MYYFVPSFVSSCILNRKTVKIQFSIFVTLPQKCTQYKCEWEAYNNEVKIGLIKKNLFCFLLLVFIQCAVSLWLCFSHASALGFICLRLNGKLDEFCGIQVNDIWCDSQFYYNAKGLKIFFNSPYQWFCSSNLSWKSEVPKFILIFLLFCFIGILSNSPFLCRYPKKKKNQRFFCANKTFIIFVKWENSRNFAKTIGLNINVLNHKLLPYILWFFPLIPLIPTIMKTMHQTDCLLCKWLRLRFIGRVNEWTACGVTNNWISIAFWHVYNSRMLSKWINEIGIASAQSNCRCV